jgi:hypothetical protein
MLRPDGTLRWPPRLGLAILLAAGLFVATISDPFTTVFFLSYALVGGLLAIRRPRNSVSWLLIAIAFSFIGTTSRPALDIARLKLGTASVADELWVWVNTWSGYATFVLFAALAAAFPSGRLPRGTWRMPILGGLVLGLAVVILAMFGPQLTPSTNGVDTILVPNPIGFFPESAISSMVPTFGIILILAALAVSIASMVARYRGGNEITRLQLRWLLVAIVFVLVGVVTGLLLGTFFPQLEAVVWIPAIIAYPTVPAAIGVAILRYRLYEIDRIVNRAIVYGAVTAILAGVFAAVTLLTQRTFVALTGQKSDAAIVLTTLAVATLYTPLRKQVERVVDLYFKYDQRIFGAYREELRRTLGVLSPEPAAQRLAREAFAETGAVGAAVVGPDGAVMASAGHWPAEASTTIALDADGAPLRAILLGSRRDGRPHRPQTVAALREVAAMAAIASAAIPITAQIDDEASHVHS